MPRWCELSMLRDEPHVSSVVMNLDVQSSDGKARVMDRCLSWKMLEHVTLARESRYPVATSY